MFLSTAVIGLREGLEAALVVVILLAFLVMSGRTWGIRYVWLGVGVAVALSVLLGAVLTLGTEGLEERTQELVGGIASLIAVVFVTFMVFWMKSAGRAMAGELQGKLDRALDLGPLAVALVGFIGVGREGLETAIFFFATAQAAAAGEGSQGLLGWAVGIGSAVALGWLIYRGALKINLTRFFRWTGSALVVVAAGILAYGVHELQEAGALPGEDNLAFDLTGTFPKTAWYVALVRGIFNLRPAMAWLELGAWALYIAIVLPLFLAPARRRKAATATAQVTA